MLPRAREGFVVACHGHGDEAHGYGAAFYCGRKKGGVSWGALGGQKAGRVEGDGGEAKRRWGEEVRAREDGWGRGYLFSAFWRAGWEYWGRGCWVMDEVVE